MSRMWRNKALPGPHLKNIQENAENKEMWQWFKKETESFLFTAAQDQALRTNAIKAGIEKNQEDIKCHLCKDAAEIIETLICGCKKSHNQTTLSGISSKVAA